LRNGALKRPEIDYRPFPALSADCRSDSVKYFAPFSGIFPNAGGKAQMHDSQVTDGTAVPILSVGIEDAPKVLGGVSRTRIFQAVQNREITIRKNGRSSIVEIAELARWLKTLPTKGRQPNSAEG
jgi:hypothetical protein